MVSTNFNNINKSQKISFQMDRDLDKISELPESLIDKILSLVPIRDAVRTSILSRNWRFKWTTISKLAFEDQLYVTQRFVKIIDRVLLLHTGPVQKFMLSLTCSLNNADIDIWIHHISKPSMTELILDLWVMEPRYKIPSSLFDCEGLTSLSLCNCSANLTVSPTFRGFKNLKILYLQRVVSNDLDAMLEKLISGSDVLEDLTLISYRFSSFDYVAPKLKRFCFRGLLVAFGFGDTSTFCSPSFHMEFHEDHTGWSNAPNCSIKLLKFIAPLQSVETLKLDGDVLKYLSIQEVPAMLAEPLLLLKNLFISGINFKSGKQLLVILCLLRSSPNLKQLKLLGADNVREDIAELDDRGAIEISDSLSTFAHLNSAWLTEIGDSVLEMAFIGILLSSSPTLEKMTIKAAKSSKLCPSERGEYKLLKNMMHLLCISTRAKLIFL